MSGTDLNNGDSVSREEIRLELQEGHRWRAQGNEGRARVCARRAAGWAVGIYRQRETKGAFDKDALENLRWLQTYPGVEPELVQAASRLCMKVNEDFSVPYKEDPLEDAQTIVLQILSPQ